MKKAKYFKDKDSWMLAEHFPNVDFFFCQIWLVAFANYLENACGRNYKKVLAVFDPKNYIHFYYGEKDSFDFEKHLIDKMKKNTGFGRALNSNIILHSDKLRKWSEDFSKKDLKKLSKKELWYLIDEQNDIHSRLYEWGWLTNATDMFHGSFTNEIKNYLEKILIKLGRGRELNQIFVTLTTPHERSVALEEEESLLKIASLLLKKKEIDKELEKHHVKYFYLKYLWIGDNGVYSRDYFLDEARKLAKDKISPDEKIKEINKELARVKKEKERLFKKLPINKKYRELFNIYSDFMLTKLYRRYAQIFWSYEKDKLLKEVSERFDLRLDEVRYMLFGEFKEALLEDKLDRADIKKRLNFFLYYTEKDYEFYTTDKNHELLEGLKKKVQKDVKELKGQVACMGKVKGTVRIINSPKEMSKMKEGDILVSICTNPDIVPAMKKAAAIVTEQGGVTSHAAIVSREMNTPCVIATKIATSVFKDGDRIEVDANKGIVRKIFK